MHMGGFPAYYTFTVPYTRERHNGACFSGEYKISVPFISAEYSSQIEWTETNGLILYTITINHRPTIIAVLAVWLLGMFFSNFTVSQLLVFAAIAAVLIYYPIHRFTVHSVRKFLKNKSEQSYTVIGREEQWVNNPDKCPACGADRDAHSPVCPECGLRLR